MTTLKILAISAVCALTATLGGLPAQAQTTAPVKARNVVLVHGAWADGSSWSEVIARLQAAGLHVTSVQNPLTSLNDAVAETRRAQAGASARRGPEWLREQVGRNLFSLRRQPRRLRRRGLHRRGIGGGRSC